MNMAKQKKIQNANMLKGSPVRLVIEFSIPLVFGNIFQQMYYIVDAVIVGKFISIQALAAVNSCSWLTWLLNAVARDFSNTVSILASYSVGKGFGETQEDRGECLQHRDWSGSSSDIFDRVQPRGNFSTVPGTR